jgi:hypothetical protein
MTVQFPVLDDEFDSRFFNEDIVAAIKWEEARTDTPYPTPEEEKWDNLDLMGKILAQICFVGAMPLSLPGETIKETLERESSAEERWAKKFTILLSKIN